MPNPIIPETFAVPDDLVAAMRDRLLTIPGVREIAEELGVLHSACISGGGAPTPPSAATPAP